MLYPGINVPDLRTALEKKICVDGIDRGLCLRVSDYIATAAIVLNDFVKLVNTLQGRELVDRSDLADFLHQFSIISQSLQEVLKDREELMDEYLFHLMDLVETARPTPGATLWKYEGFEGRYDECEGIYSHLLSAGIDEEVMERSYLDVNILDVYEKAIEVLQALEDLCSLPAVNLSDLHEGLNAIHYNLKDNILESHLQDIAVEDQPPSPGLLTGIPMIMEQLRISATS